MGLNARVGGVLGLVGPEPGMSEMSICYFADTWQRIPKGIDSMRHFGDPHAMLFADHGIDPQDRGIHQ